MKSTQITLMAASILAAANLNALSIEVQKFEEGVAPPAGYQDVSEGIDATGVINVSADPFVDYLIPSNSGTAGIIAQKTDGQFIVSSTVDAMGGSGGGANSGIETDYFQVVFAWDDGTPLPFASDFLGVSWANWSADSVATLTTRVDLASDEEITIYHWFNDGWNYGAGHNVLPDGHKLTITQFAADDSVISSQTMDLTSGGAESYFGDHRQFYSAIITATASAAGDYIIIDNEGGNIGYKGTAVAQLSSDAGLSVEVQKFEDGAAAPAGYQDVSDGIDAADVINVSADPFVDYLIPSNSGTAGIIAQKTDGQFIVSSTVDAMGGSGGGANSGIETDYFQVVFAWDDGTPLPFASDFLGVSWANWSADSIATLTTRVDLASDQEVTIYHWFNDGWNYGAGHNVLPDGHKLTVTHYAADDSEISSETMNLTSGGAEGIFGDHRQFYSAIITATASAAGDYIIIDNEGGNIGYKGTAVAITESAGTMWNGYDVDANGWVNTGDWMSWVNVTFDPYIFILGIENYAYIEDDSGWMYVYK